RVESFETLIEIGPLLSGRVPPMLIRTPRVAVVTTTGGGAASVADRMGLLGLDVATPDDSLIATLAAGGVTIRKAPIIDLTLAATSKSYGAVLAALAQWPGCDAVLGVVGSSAQFHPQLAVEPIVVAPRSAKPLAAFLTPEATDSLKVLAAAYVPAFRTPESCAEAHAAFFAWRAPADDLSSGSKAKLGPTPRRTTLSELEALDLFKRLGLHVASSALAVGPDYAHSVPFPVAVKIASADITHKSDLGGVRLNIATQPTLRAAAAEMEADVHRARPLARIDGVTVQAMQRGLGEAIVGYRHDPQVGPLVLVGAGGTLAEIYRDYALEMAPVDLARARAMIASVKGFAVLRGYRGAPAADLEALAHAVVAFSRLATVAGQPIAEAEVNPVIVTATDAIAVDGVVVMQVIDKG
ncbi:MAG: acetate--CoA ligase family protein, partial [Burkholderiales bacterium]